MHQLFSVHFTFSRSSCLLSISFSFTQTHTLTHTFRTILARMCSYALWNANQKRNNGLAGLQVSAIASLVLSLFAAVQFNFSFHFMHLTVALIRSLLLQMLAAQMDFYYVIEFYHTHIVRNLSRPPRAHVRRPTKVRPRCGAETGLVARRTTRKVCGLISAHMCQWWRLHRRHCNMRPSVYSSSTHWHGNPSAKYTVGPASTGRSATS